MNSSAAQLRKIIHIDMDAFYASVEQRDQPHLKHKPVVVGGDPNSRGVVAACSYEARKFGIHSAMPCARAYKLCPKAVFIRPRFDAYKSVSCQIREIFLQYTDLVEPLSLDEAFLDVTDNKKGKRFATRIAQDIRRKIYEKTDGLTASAGVSFNKFLAKVASDVNKPDGIKVITPQQAEAFIEQLPIRKFFGVGKVTEEKMIRLGIRTGSDLKTFSCDELTRLFGKAGRYFHDIAHGVDNRPVEPDRVRKSVGKETTLSQDTDDVDRMIHILDGLAEKVGGLLKRNNLKGFTVTLKIRYHDFRSVTRSVTLPEPVTDAEAIMAIVRDLLPSTEAGPKKVRLLGVTVANFLDDRCRGILRQLPLPLKVDKEYRS